MIMSEHADAIEPNFGSLFENEPLPSGGYISLPHDAHGFGLTLNKKALNLQRPFSHAIARPLTAAEAGPRSKL
jgi:L-rhamnonate dehydratase